MKKISEAQSAQLNKLQNEVTEKEKAETELQRKLTDIQNEDTQLKQSLQKKEGKYYLDEALCEKYENDQ